MNRKEEKRKEEKKESDGVTSHTGNVNWNLDRQYINEFSDTKLGLDATELRALLSASVLLEDSKA